MMYFKTHLLYIAQPVQQVSSGLRYRGFHREFEFEAPLFEEISSRSSRHVSNVYAPQLRLVMHLVTVATAFQWSRIAELDEFRQV